MTKRVRANQDVPRINKNNIDTCGRCGLAGHEGRCDAPDGAFPRRSGRLSEVFQVSNDGPKAKPASNRNVKGQVLVPKRKKRSTRFQDRGQADYSSGIYKLKKRFCPGEGISDMAMQILNDFLNDMFKQIATQAMKLMQQDKKVTLSARSVRTAILLIFPPELSAHVLHECDTAARKALYRKRKESPQHTVVMN